MKRIFLISLIFLSVLNCRAQGLRDLAPVEGWQYHFPLRLAHTVTTSENMVYCAATAGLYYYDLETGSLGQFTKEDGLASIEISTINYHKELGYLVVAYRNTNVDLISDEAIINLNDIFRKQIIGDKSINKIVFRGNTAYLACNFGVVVVDMEKMEIKETYQSLDTDGTSLNVHDITFSDSLIYLGTNKGVLYGSLASSVNLLDFNNWSRFTTLDSLPNLPCTAIEYFNDQVFAYFADTLDSTTYVYDQVNWKLDSRFEHQILDFEIGDGELIASTEDTIIILNENEEVSYLTSDFGFINHTVSDSRGMYWVADFYNGLTKFENGQTEVLKPVSPSNAQIFKLRTIDDKIYALRGGYDGSYTQLNAPMNIDVLDDYNWGTITYQYDPASALYNVKDVQDVVEHPENDKLYYASHGYGLIEEYEKDKFNIYNDLNSPLINALDSGTFVRITGLAFDDENSLWMTNHTVPTSKPSLHKRSEDGTWQSFVFPDIDGASYPEGLIVDEQNQKWLILSFKFGGGILLVDETGENYRLLNSAFEEGMLPTKHVLCIAEDNKGEIWVGTADGVAVFSFPENMFDPEFDTDATTPIFEGRPLLESESVNCIEVDEGNRKWIGTPRGLWLFDEDGINVIHNFTKENSPLPSNNILDLTIQPKTGEVFISTDKGLVSYRSNATEGFVECSDNVEVFPNPVRPEYDGQIAVRGLKNNAGVKIVDMAGNLVYETEAYGGTATWNGRDYNNQRVASGIYQFIVYGGSRKRSCLARVVILN